MTLWRRPKRAGEADTDVSAGDRHGEADAAEAETAVGLDPELVDSDVIALVAARLGPDAEDPASAAEVAELEHGLGVALPPLLRRLYTEVANGGFGPGDGAIGLVGGARPDRPHSSMSMLTWTIAQRMPDDEGPVRWPGLPANLVPLCHWGCAIWSCVDCASEDGAVIRFDPNEAGSGDDEDPWLGCWSLEAPSLGQWLTGWLQGDVSFTTPTG